MCRSNFSHRVSWPLNPSARRVRSFPQWLRPKKDFGRNETKSKAGQCKEQIIYSISSPLGLCHIQVKKAYFKIISALKASTLLKIPPYNRTNMKSLSKTRVKQQKRLRDRKEKGKCTNKWDKRVGLSTLDHPFYNLKYHLFSPTIHHWPFELKINSFFTIFLIIIKSITCKPHMYALRTHFLTDLMILEACMICWDSLGYYYQRKVDY